MQHMADIRYVVQHSVKSPIYLLKEVYTLCGAGEKGLIKFQTFSSSFHAKVPLFSRRRRIVQ